MRLGRRVTVELLRRGPRHNQLLSPLTDYLAVCDEAPAGVVNVPYEHAHLEHELEELRYDVSSVDGSARLATTRDRVGSAIASMLASIPNLSGALQDPTERGNVMQLCVVTSAGELSLLPFELSKLPVAGQAGETWLALDPEHPICLTRRIRSVKTASGPWPTKPRILFASHGDDVPFEQHLDVLSRVLEPWQNGGLSRASDNPRRWTSEYLVVIEQASLDEIRAAMADGGFTHVHVLAHGAEIEDSRSTRYGIALDRTIRGRDLALVMSSLEGRPPFMVTLASCDTGAQGSVVTPGGSVADDLHYAGVPLVVASQFPLSMDASVPFVELLYRGQLTGEHPLLTITELRRRLATAFPDEHAWASVVVYEALPVDFDEELEDFRYWQARRAHEKALMDLEELATSDQVRALNLNRLGKPFADEFDSPVPEEHEARVGAVVAAALRLPSTGQFAAECAGLRAAGLKRMAEVAFWLSAAPDATPERRHQLIGQSIRDLEAALLVYTEAMESMLRAGAPTDRKASFHWLLGQVLLLQAILGVEVDQDVLGAARLTTRLDLDHPEPMARAWARVSLIELAMLRLTTGATGAKATRAASAEAVRCANDIAEAQGFAAEPVQATRRQMRRYLTWWGDDEFVASMRDFGVNRTVRWDAAHGVLATAREVVAALTPQSVVDLPSPELEVVEESGTPRPAVARPARTQPSESRTAPTGLFEIDMLPAENGDCLWIRYGEDGDRARYVLIDCGSVGAARVASERVRNTDGVELFVLTHIDADHISGAVPLFSDAEVATRFKDVWFNGWNQLRGFLSVAQGEAFSDLLDRDERPFSWNQTERRDDPPPPIVTDGQTHPEVVLAGGMRITVLSPTPAALRRLALNWRTALMELNPSKAMLARRPRPVPVEAPAALDLEELAASGPTKDSSVPNLSSIALLAEFGGRSVLFTGDAHADVVEASIRSLQERRGRGGQPIQLDALKLSHHGSANATTRKLLEAVTCSNYLVPTNGNIFYHPDRSAIARVVIHGGSDPTLHFNYRTDLNDFWGDEALQRRYGFRTRYPDPGSEGLDVAL